MAISKAEVYRMIVEATVKTGQGLPGIIKLGRAPEIGQHLDDLVEEGVVTMTDDGGTIGHPESNRWYLPAEGYNVFRDGRRAQHLNKVRFYLGALSEPDPSNTDIQNAMHPSHAALASNVEFMKSYIEWLENNHEELEVMKNLDPTYIPAVIQFTKQESKWIKTRSWYKENKTIAECLETSTDQVDTVIKPLINNYKKMLTLIHQQEPSEKYPPEKYEEGLDKEEIELEKRKKLHHFFRDQENQDAQIKSIKWVTV